MLESDCDNGGLLELDVLPLGPASLEDCFMMPLAQAEKLKSNQYGIDLWPNLVSKFTKGIDASSDYSGAGQFETALGLQDQTVRHIEKPSETDYKGFRLLRAGDVLPHCRRVLKAHSPHRPNCINGDMTARMPQVVKENVQVILDLARAQVEDGKQLKTVGTLVMNQIVEMLTTLNSEGKLPTEITAYCHTHKKVCPVVQQRRGGSDLDSGRFSMHAAGISCLDWSSRGTQQGYCGTTLWPMVQWLLERLIADEDAFVVECTRFWKPTILQMLFPDRQVFWHVFSPKHIGVPADRHRVYAVATKTSRVRWILPWNSGQLIKNLFYCAIRLPGSVYYRAPLELVNNSIATAAVARQLPACRSDGQAWRYIHVCPAGKRRRVMAYRDLASQQAAASHPPGDEDVIFDLCQYPRYGSITRVMPCLTRSTCPYNMLHKRSTLPEEKLEVMGLPAFVPDSFMFQTPFKSLLMGNTADGLSAKELEQLMGNAMHVSAVGTVLMALLGCTELIHDP